MRYALIALCSSLPGVTLVLKRFSFIGDGLSHAAFGLPALRTKMKLAYTNMAWKASVVTPAPPCGARGQGVRGFGGDGFAGHAQQLQRTPGQPRSLIGRQSMEKLPGRISGRDENPSELVIRSSSGRYRNA